LIVLWPLKGGIDHHGTSSPNGVFDGIFGHTIVMVPSNTTVTDTLAFGDQFGGELLGSIDPIIGTVVANLDTNGGSLTLKTELGLHGFSAGESNLVDCREFTAGGVAEDSATRELLSSDVVT
jgi:hypothetical protein